MLYRNTAHRSCGDATMMAMYVQDAIFLGPQAAQVFFPKKFMMLPEVHGAAAPRGLLPMTLRGSFMTPCTQHMTWWSCFVLYSTSSCSRPVRQSCHFHRSTEHSMATGLAWRCEFMPPSQQHRCMQVHTLAGTAGSHLFASEAGHVLGRAALAVWPLP